MVDATFGVLGLIISIVGIVVGNASGAGAGGFVVPCFFICFGYSLAQSVALWNAVILIVSLWRVINSIYAKERHPEGDRPIIDFDSVLIFQPAIFIGIEVGFITMEILPEGVKILVFSFMLATLTFFTFNKAMTRYRLEAKTEQLIVSERKSSLELVVDKAEECKEEKKKVAEVSKERPKYEGVYFPVHKFVVNMFSFVLLTTTHMILGSSKSASIIGIPTCSTSYWAVLTIYFTALVGLLIYSYSLVRSEREANKALGMKFLPSEFEWTRELIINVGLLAVLAGFFSSSYGVGGGLILNMVLIFKGVNPEVVTATTMLSIVFICVSTTTVYWINHILPLDGYAITLIILGLPVTVLSYSVLKNILQKHSSLILFTLAGALGVSSVLINVFGFYKVYYIDHSTKVWSFGGLCPVHH